MALRPPADPNRHREAIAWFKARVPMTKGEWSKLEEAAREKAFTVAGGAQLDLVTHVWDAITKALESGETMEDFRARVRDQLTRAWGKDNPSRIETIFRTNVQLAYSRGRQEQLTEDAVLRVRPFWKFSAVLDGRTTEVCRHAHGTILSADDRWWTTHTPPLHFNCRSAIISLTEDQAERQGVTTKPTRSAPDDGFGAADPVEWQPDLQAYPEPLVRIYKRTEQ